MMRSIHVTDIFGLLYKWVMSASNHSLNTHIQTGCVCECVCVSGAYLCCHRVRGGYRTGIKNCVGLVVMLHVLFFTYFGLKHTEILCNLKKCVLQMVASLDSEFLQLPVLKEHILCNKVNTVKGQELQELRGQISRLFIYWCIYFSVWIKTDWKTQTNRNSKETKMLCLVFLQPLTL